MLKSLRPIEVLALYVILGKQAAVVCSAPAVLGPEAEIARWNMTARRIDEREALRRKAARGGQSSSTKPLPPSLQ